MTDNSGEPLGTEARVARLESDLAEATALIAALAERVGGAGDGDVPAGSYGQPASQRWPWFVLCDIEDDAPLSVWVAWLGRHYIDPDTSKSIVYDCWQQHDAVIAELATLWQAWRAAFLDTKASPDAAQNWHDRWLPGFMQRRDVWFHKDCRNGRHHDPAA